MESATILTASFGVNLHLFLQFTDKAILKIALFFWKIKTRIATLFFDSSLYKYKLFTYPLPIYINTYTHSVLFVGMYANSHRTRRLIRFSTVCSQNVLLEFE